MVKSILNNEPSVEQNRLHAVKSYGVMVFNYYFRFGINYSFL
jgi:hypothetical protein